MLTTFSISILNILIIVTLNYLTDTPQIAAISWLLFSELPYDSRFGVMVWSVTSILWWVEEVPDFKFIQFLPCCKGGSDYVYAFYISKVKPETWVFTF